MGQAVFTAFDLEWRMSTFVTSDAGVRIPGIIYGTAWKTTDTERLVTLAIRLGFRGIDTACQPKHYNETGVGAGLAMCLADGMRRGDVYLQTKFTPVSGQDPSRIPYDPKAPLPEQVAQSFAASLRNLQTDYVDCLVLHSPLPAEKQTLQAWRAIETIVDAGGIRQAGISNCYNLCGFPAPVPLGAHKTGRSSEPFLCRHRIRSRAPRILQAAAHRLPKLLDADCEPAVTRACHDCRVGVGSQADTRANPVSVSDTGGGCTGDRNPLRSAHARRPVDL